MIEKIAVLGSGTMGHGIAEAFAMHGFPVNLYDTDAVRLKAAKEEIAAELQLLVAEEYIDASVAEKALSLISLQTDLKEAVKDRDYVIEAVPEIIALKQDLFALLDQLCPSHTILASNTSSLKLADMMEKVSPARRERMLVNHWYNPGHIMPIVEMSFFGNMPESIYQEVEALFAAIEKQTVKVLKDVPGLVANRIQQGVAREVFSIIEQGIAAPEDVDKALKFGPAFRYATTGQLEVADFGGLDIWCTVGDNLLKVMDASTAANPLLKEKVAEGKLGAKSGEGFFKYPPETLAEKREVFLKKLIHQLKAAKYYVDK
ncbi:MAG: 3-hydroxyacyl-CoA dehydrogenase NAD-binding domain-containing protein [Sporomusaceae bacterium]|nr:3-hydroxyacyl-CoA dehydrogenase NAD-binding domain-containing protein [Sporomusaceae bacterium]